MITAEHLCVSSRGIKDVNSSTISSFFGGKFESEQKRLGFNNYRDVVNRTFTKGNVSHHLNNL